MDIQGYKESKLKCISIIFLKVEITKIEDYIDNLNSIELALSCN